jgi:hypothetical protein
MEQTMEKCGEYYGAARGLSGCPVVQMKGARVSVVVSAAVRKLICLVLLGRSGATGCQGAACLLTKGVLLCCSHDLLSPLASRVACLCSHSAIRVAASSDLDN